MITITKRIEFRGMDSLATMEDHVNQQLVKIENFLQHERTPIVINIVLEKHPTHAHNAAHVHISVPIHEKTIDIVVKREGENLYTCIDEALDLAYRDLLNAKRELVDQVKHGK